MSGHYGYDAWQRVLVYGLGASGQAAARFLSNRGIQVLAADRRPVAELELGDLTGKIEFQSSSNGTEPTHLPRQLDAVVVSPGVPLDRPLLVEAKKQGLPVVAEVELAFAFLDGAVIGITGSNGKSTTTAMTGALLEASGIKARVCGNIGVPLISVIDDSAGEVFVVELSSFQLEAVNRFRPKAAALLNVSPDHLDRHRSIENYMASKARLFARQEPTDVAVLNADDPFVRDVGTKARRRYFSRRDRVSDGCFLDGDSVVEVGPESGPEDLFRRSDVRQPGEHNLENAMAAALLARSLGASPAHFARALAGFPGLPHRMQSVALVDGVHWIDDSKGTNVGAVVMSLAGLEDQSVHLILGGQGKGESFLPLVEPVQRKASSVYLIGETAAEIRDQLESHLAPEAIKLAEDLPQAVAMARKAARAGDTVLLSPACASFDQYQDFAERGNHYQELVREGAGGGGG